jgi:hypothetical protein
MEAELYCLDDVFNVYITTNRNNSVILDVILESREGGTDARLHRDKILLHINRFNLSKLKYEIDKQVALRNGCKICLNKFCEHQGLDLDYCKKIQEHPEIYGVQ